MNKDILKNESTKEVVCPHCEQEVSKEAIVCPFCGFGILAWLAGEIDENGDLMTGEQMWQAFCHATNTDENTRHDIWKFCGGGIYADELANLVLSGVKTATASTKLAYEMQGEKLPDVGTYSVILFDNDKAACIIRDVKVSIVPFNQVGAEHAYKEGEDDRSLQKWRETHLRAFTPDYEAAGLEFDENGDCVLEEFEVVYR